MRIQQRVNDCKVIIYLIGLSKYKKKEEKDTHAPSLALIDGTSNIEFQRKC